MVYVDPGRRRARSTPIDASRPDALAGGAREGGEPRGAQRGAARTFRGRAVPEPGAALREAAELTNDARLDVPSTVMCTGFTSAQNKGAVQGRVRVSRRPTELRDVTYLDLPTSHWPMWSRPQELAEIIAAVAKAQSVR